MMKWNKHTGFPMNINIRSFGYIIIVSLLFSQNLYGQDSIHLDTAITPKINENEEIKKIYNNPNYYDAIPVSQWVPIKDSVGVQQSFSHLKSRYRSPEFNYNENRADRMSWLDRVLRKVGDFIKQLIPPINWDLQRAMYYVFIGAGALLVIFILYKLILSGKNPGFKEVKELDEEPTEWIEKKLMETDLKGYLHQALKNQNYTLAVRYLHLINLKKLATKGHITWHYQKTNHEFLNELSNHQLRPPFARTIRVYEYIWYGHFVITSNDFENYQQLFHSFNQEIS